MNSFDQHLDSIKKDIEHIWDTDIIPTLCEYIRIPNKSPHYDPDWEQHGYMQQAMQLIVDWCQRQPIVGMQCELLQTPGRTPLLFIDIPGTGNETVLLYGHMDKQPEMVGWDADKGPWKPVIQDNKLYGRGGADDGYSVFSSLLAILLLQRHKIPHARCVLIIEGCEESGSGDLTHYLEKLEDRMGEPNFVICLDASAGNYEQLWATTSLRGMVSGELHIEVLTEGIHSGFGSGVVPSVEMVLRKLLDRIENADTGEIIVPEFKAHIPDFFVKQAELAAAVLNNEIIDAYPFADSTAPVNYNLAELILNRSWRSQLSITGIEGFPLLHDAGNVTLPKATFKLSLRIPPTLKSSQYRDRLKEILERDPPFNASVRFTPTERATGWSTPEIASWVKTANDEASHRFYSKPAMYIGEGGLIPFMGMLGRKFPKAQFLITGVLGPHSNAHGPNEFLHIPMAKRITGCVASVIAAHHEHTR